MFKGLLRTDFIVWGMLITKIKTYIKKIYKKVKGGYNDVEVSMYVHKTSVKREAYALPAHTGTRRSTRVTHTQYIISSQSIIGLRSYGAYLV